MCILATTAIQSTNFSGSVAVVCSKAANYISSSFQAAGSAIASAASKAAAFTAAFFKACGNLAISGYGRFRNAAAMGWNIMSAHPGATYIGLSAVALIAILAVVYAQSRSAEEIYTARDGKIDKTAKEAPQIF